MEGEAASLAIIDGGAEDIGGQEIAGELHAAELKPEGLRERLGEQRLADTGLIFKQQMPASQQAGDGEADDLFFAEDDLGQRLIEKAQTLRRSGSLSSGQDEVVGGSGT
jgi:hypothetical protein